MRGVYVSCFLALLPLAVSTTDSLRSGTPWFDTDGNLINAHGAGLLQHNSTYYWYGSRRCLDCPGTQMDGGIACYSSRDLYSWKFESVVLPVFNCSSSNQTEAYPPPSCSNGNGLDLERPKVVQCGGTGKFVMWVRGTGYGNSPQLLAVLTSESPTGPFTFVSNRTGSDDPFRTVAEGIENYPAGYQYADATLFQDPVSRSTFVYWRTRISSGLSGPTGFRGMQLSEDCTDVLPESDTRITETPNREAPAMFLYNHSYYLWTSGTEGWQPTSAFLYMADSPLGAFANSSQNGHGWHSFIKSLTAEAVQWTVRTGYLATGSVYGNQSKFNLTLSAAQAMCGAAKGCAGFTFNDYDAAPAASKVLSVSLKTQVHYVPEGNESGLQPPAMPTPGAIGNQKPNQPGAWAFDSQSTYILPNPHYNETTPRVAPFIYIGDRWDYQPHFGTSKATYIWLPLFIDPHNPRVVRVVWSAEWRLDDTDLFPF